MSQIIGSGIIEVSADATKLKAGIDDAKRSLSSLGIAAKDATKSQSASIDRYVKQLGVAAVTTGKTARELELYKLALRGASAEQLKAADSALKMTEGYERGAKIGDAIKKGFVTLGAVAATSLIATYAAFDQLTKKAGAFQDMAEKTGDTAQNIASLAVAAGTAGTGMETIVSASAKLTKGLTGVDDESKAAGAAIAALGLNIKDFKALDGFQDGAQKTAVAMALFGKAGAELLPFLKELGQEGGRQVILTQAQIELADNYADKQAKLRTELSLHAQAIATQMLPAYNAFTGALTDVAKELLGVENGVSTLTKDNAIAEFAATAARGLATIADTAFFVGQSVRSIGESYGAAAAIIASVGRGDFSGASAIANAARESGDAMKFNLGLAEKVELRLAAIAKKTGAIGIKPGEMDSWDSKKKLKFEGVDPKGKDTAAQEAKAQLGLDLENIKNSYGSLIATYSNSEKIMQAMHAAGLVDEQDYYASKLGFLNLNSAAQEKDLSEQIARMEQENLIGKDRLENEKKIAETRAKLAIVKASNTAGVEVNTIQGAAASTKRNTEVDKFFEDAQKAAGARSIANVEGIRRSLQTELEAEQEGYTARIDSLTASMELGLSTRTEGNKLIEAEELRHAEALSSMQLAAGQNVLSITQSSADQLYSALKSAGLEQTALGKAMFIAQKAVQVASIIVNTEVAAAAAQAGMIAAAATTAAVSGPAGPGIIAAGFATGAAYATATRAMGYITAGIVAGTAIAQASARDGYDIPAGVNPMTQLHEKEMVLPQAQANVIRDMAKSGSGAGGGGNTPITIINQTTGRIDKVTQTTLSNGERALIIQETKRSYSADLGDPNSGASKAMARNFNNQRSR